MCGDFRLHQYLAEREQPRGRVSPPQVLSAGDRYGHEVKVVFRKSGEAVPWFVTYVNCPEGYLMRYSAPGSRVTLREDGDFKVVWDD